MNAQQEIKDAQREWAGRPPGIPFDAKGYVDDVEANLWAPLSAHARNGYEKAAEKPLAKDMKALHSSSSLVANFFEYWTNRDDKAPLLSALCIDANGVRTLDFERKFHTEISVKKNGGIPPHLDVGITLDSNHVVAIESKFTEPLSCATVNKSKFKPSYFPPSGGLWAKQGLHDCQKFAQELNEGHHKFKQLDAWQLLKHALGLATQRGKTEFSPYYNEFRLYYLYYDWPGEQSEAHKKEIKRFADRVGDELRFKAHTYQEVYRKLSDATPPDAEYQDYLCYLGKRYFCGKGAPK